MLESMESMAREQVREILPNAVRITLESYRDFVCDGLGLGDTPKDISANHGAGKAALTHINLLLKLSQWADLEAQKGEGAVVDMASAKKGYQNFLNQNGTHKEL